jgi:hypothetical protein
MNGSDKQHRAILQSIAHRVMLERGLFPDFSAQALAELDRFQAPAAVNGDLARDLRDLLWASIDDHARHNATSVHTAALRTFTISNVLIIVLRPDQWPAIRITP